MVSRTRLSWMSSWNLFETRVHLGWSQDALPLQTIGLSSGATAGLCGCVLARPVPRWFFRWANSALDQFQLGRLAAGLKKDRPPCSWHVHATSKSVSDKGFFLDGDLIEYNDTNEMFLNPAKRRNRTMSLVNSDRKKIKCYEFNLKKDFRVA